MFSKWVCKLETSDENAVNEVNRHVLHEPMLQYSCKGSGPLTPGAAMLTIYPKASSDPNGLNPNVIVTVGRSSVGIPLPF
jgi:hypothetical protein